MEELFNKLINITFIEYQQDLTDAILNNKKKIIVTANPETFVMALEDENLYNVLLDSKVDLVADGIGLVKMSNRYKNKLKERIPGIEITEYLLSECNRLKKSVYFYGAKESVLIKLIHVIKINYPDLQILGYKNGYDYNRDQTFLEIAKLKPDLCLVALGIPYQEKLIYKNIEKIQKGVFVGVGGTFDVLSGEKKRAPKIFLKLNLEWLYRIVVEPKRLKRFYKCNVKFIKSNLKCERER